jgi:hypothetical protein
MGARHGMRARSQVIAHHSLPAMARGYLAVYDKLIAGAAAGTGAGASASASASTSAGAGTGTGTGAGAASGHGG